MGEFFKVWQTKVGCVTLVAASLLMSGWVRSMLLEDDLQFPNNGLTSYFISSEDGSIFWSRFDDMSSGTSSISASTGWVYSSRPRQAQSVEEQIHSQFDPATILIFKWCGFFRGVAEFHRSPISYKFRFWAIPYWSVVLPLTLLSAYLLLVKPRVAKPKIVGEN